MSVCSERAQSRVGSCVLFILATCAFVTLALTLDAQNVERCVEQQRGHPVPPPCNPPQTYTAPNAKPPFDGLLRLGAIGKIGGQATFTWIKAGEPSRPCTAAEAKNGSAYKMACAAKIGDPIIVLPQFRALASSAFASLSSSTSAPAIRRIDALDVFGSLTGERFCRTGTTSAVCAGKRRWHFVAIKTVARLQVGWGPDPQGNASLPRVSHFWPESFAVNSWMVIPVPDDSQFVDFAYVGGGLISPVLRIKDLAPITVTDLAN